MTAEQVKALEVGQTVTVRKAGCGAILCTVACRGCPDNKFLTYRDLGQIKHFAIRDYPDMEYAKGEGT